VVQRRELQRVGFDDQIFQAQRRGGISKYFVELFHRLPAYGVEPVILSTRTHNLHLAESGFVPTAPPVGRLRERTEWATWRAWGRPRTTPRPFPAIDVLHHTFTHGSYLSLPFAGPRVVTIFDMTPELFPSYFRWGNPHFQKRKYAAVSDAVISISQNTQEDLERLYGPVSGAQVIPFGVGEQFLERRPDAMTLPDSYVLFVGVRSGYKHFDTLVAAFARLTRDHPDLRLVVVGGGPFSAAEGRLMEAAGIADRVDKLAPTDEQMPEVYRRARVFAFPSIYEGFGLPTLEALSSGTPTVLADASCSREVGGDAAIYFAPQDVDDLVDKLVDGLAPAAREFANSAGPARGRLFGWDRVASKTAELYRSLT
jgi:glycosyltransferase involved in cell wall biosynthesis